MPGLKLGKEAQAKFDEAKINPDKAGILDKKGAKRKNWNERWFVLKDNYLFYCKNEKSNPQGIINLHGCTVSQIQGPTARANSFSLLAPKSVSIDAKWTNRTYFVAAKSPKEMQLWMEKLEDSGKKAVEKAQARKTETTTTAQKEVITPTASKSAESDSSDEDSDKEEVKKEEVKKEEPKKVEEVKKEEPKKEEVKKEEPKEEKKEVVEESKEDADAELNLPSSPRTEKKSKKEKKDKKEKKSKKSKKSKKEKKPKRKDSSEEEKKKSDSESEEEKKASESESD